MKKGNLTGIKDVDNIILDNMNDRDLLSFCSTNKYNADVVCSEDFWKRRFKNKFGFSTWKKAYLSKISERYYIVWWSGFGGIEVASEDKEEELRNLLIYEIRGVSENLIDEYDNTRGEKYLNIDLNKFSTEKLVEICQDLGRYRNDINEEGDDYVVIDVFKGQRLHRY